MSRVMDRPEDFTRLGIDPDRVEAWEDGRRDTDEPQHAEVWYLDCHLDDESTLVLGFRPKPPERVAESVGSPNVAINYTHADGTPYTDFRLYDVADTSMSTERCDLRYGPSTLTGDWKTYDIHIEPEPEQEIVLDGKTSTVHDTAVDLHFEAQTEPFRPGTGYVAFGPDDSSYYNFICVTKLSVTGHVVIDGEDKQVTGSAYYNHQWLNVAPTMAIHHWLWGRQNIGAYNVLIYDMVAGESLGLDQIPLLAIDDAEGNRVFENTSTEGFRLEVLDSYVQEQTDKRYPSKVRYTFDHGDTKVRYTISDPKEINTIDFYGISSPEAQKQFDAAHLRPSYIRYLAQAELDLTRDGRTETTTGPMLYEFNYPGTENPDAHLF